HRARDGRQHLVGAHAQLGRAVDRAGRQEDVAATMRFRRRGQGAEGGVDILLVGARQGGEDRPLDLARHAADAFLVARRGGGEARLDHIHAQVAQDMGHFQLGFGRHGEARRLFAVAQGGVEDDDPVGIGRDLGGSGYSFYAGHYAASDWK
uniref:Autotransporter outer membrane beta-barrel domain-containing protein n=1 Tax=Parastrongyloides trichosuri TaxID=131310 RepID=A0A0N4Z6B5_PARTI